jgi:hypothetical protein
MMMNTREDAAPTERLNRNPGQAPATHRGFRQPSQPAQAAPQATQASVDHRTSDQSGRGQRTRRTVDLPAGTHRALDIWQREAADRLGVARVTGQEVLTALIDQLLVDPKLASQIVRAIESRR